MNANAQLWEACDVPAKNCFIPTTGVLIRAF
jgi:hypothetical protein